MREEISADLAARIKYWRTSAGLRATDLARVLKMSDASVSRWESGSALPSIRTLHKIAAACGVTTAMFMAQLPEAD